MLNEHKQPHSKFELFQVSIMLITVTPPHIFIKKNIQNSGRCESMPFLRVLMLNKHKQVPPEFEIASQIAIFMLITITLPRTFIQNIYRMQGDLDSCLSQRCQCELNVSSLIRNQNSLSSFYYGDNRYATSVPQFNIYLHCREMQIHAFPKA